MTNFGKNNQANITNNTEEVTKTHIKSNATYIQQNLESNNQKSSSKKLQSRTSTRPENKLSPIMAKNDKLLKK